MVKNEDVGNNVFNSRQVVTADILFVARVQVTEYMYV